MTGVQTCALPICKLSPEITQAQTLKDERRAAARKDLEAKKARNAASRVSPGSSGAGTAKLSIKEEIKQNYRKAAAA